MKNEIIKLIEIEQKKALKHYRFHQNNTLDNYGFLMWFNGQRRILRKLKNAINKL